MRPTEDPQAVRAVAQVFVEDLSSPEIAPEDRHHLRDVLRLRPGELVIASDGRGNWRTCRVKGSTELLSAEGPLQSAERPAPVAVGFALLKGGRHEWIVQKLTEIGVDRIALVRSVRSVARWDAERWEKVLHKLQRIAREACCQSRRVWLPEVIASPSLDELAQSVAPDKLHVAQLGATPPDRSTRAVVVGPEGGWDDAELLPGLPQMGLARGVLRAETAAVVAGTLLCSLRDGYLEPLRGAPAPGP